MLLVVMIEPVYSSLQLPGLSAVFGAWHASPRLERMVHRARLDRRRKTELRSDSVVDIARRSTSVEQNSRIS